MIPVKLGPDGKPIVPGTPQPQDSGLEQQMMGMQDKALSGAAPTTPSPAASAPYPTPTQPSSEGAGGMTGTSQGPNTFASNGANPSPYSPAQSALSTAQNTAMAGQPGAPQANAALTAAKATATATGAQPQAAPTSYQQMEGVDMAKMNDQSHTSPKYVASRILASGGSLADAAKAIGATVLDATRMRLSTGEVIDTRRDEEGANALQWLVMGGGPGDTAGAGAGTQGLAGAGGVGGAGMGAGGMGSYAGSIGGGDIGAAIARLLGRGEGATGAQDPNIAGPTAAYRAAQDREVRRSRNAMAERAAAGGLNYGGSGSGSFDSALQSQSESEGINVANYQGQLITKEIAAKRQDVVNALQFAQGQEKLSLEQYLAQLNDQLQRAQMGQQNQQFYDNYGLRMAEDTSGLDRQLMSYLQ